MTDDDLTRIELLTISLREFYRDRALRTFFDEANRLAAEVRRLRARVAALEGGTDR